MTSSAERMKTSSRRVIYERKCEELAIYIDRLLTSTSKLTLHSSEMMQAISNVVANAIYAISSGGMLDFYEGFDHGCRVLSAWRAGAPRYVLPLTAR